jgi:hypothetical protein
MRGKFAQPFLTASRWFARNPAGCRATHLLDTPLYRIDRLFTGVFAHAHYVKECGIAATHCIILHERCISRLWPASCVSDPTPARVGACEEQAPMLTSPLSDQEPFPRSAQGPTAGWHLSPALWKPAVKQVDGEEQPVQGTYVALLPAAAPGGWLCLCERSGAAPPCLKAGVSAPIASDEAGPLRDR